MRKNSSSADRSEVSTIVIIIYISLSYIVIYISYMHSTQFFTLFLKCYRTLICIEYSILY